MAQQLIHIGYPKAGSTFLQAWFERHPELAYAPGGFCGYSNVFELAFRPRDKAYKYYVTSFEGLAIPQESADDWRSASNGETAEQAIGIKKKQAQVCSVLKNLYPNGRILIITRGFKDMIISCYSQYARHGGVLHMEAMCQKLIESFQVDEFHYFDYDYLIPMYEEKFGAGNVIVLPYELLRDDQEGFLTTLQEKLGLEQVKIELGRLNPSLSAEELYWYPVISRAVSATASYLGPVRSQQFNRWYKSQRVENKLTPFIDKLKRWMPDKKITERDFPKEILSYCVNKAIHLKKNPLYAPYAAEYLWSGQ